MYQSIGKMSCIGLQQLDMVRCLQLRVLLEILKGAADVATRNITDGNFHSALQQMHVHLISVKQP